MSKIPNPKVAAMAPFLLPNTKHPTTTRAFPKWTNWCPNGILNN